MENNVPVDLSEYIFPVIDYDPTESPRHVVTADEWNTILNLLKASINYTNKALQDIVQDLYTATELSSSALGEDGSRKIGVDLIPGVTGTNVNAVLRNLKTQIDSIVLGTVPDGSITSAKLANNLNFAGTVLTFNSKSILTSDNIVNTLTNPSTTQAPSVTAVVNALNTKQDKITKGTSAPTSSTPGDIYLQYI